MNAVFTLITLSSAILLLFEPEQFLPALTDGAQNAVRTAAMLFLIYAVWMGLSAVAEDSGLTRSLSRRIRKPLKRLFRTGDDQAAENIAMNISCNLLGIGGAATPYAVRAIARLEGEDNAFGQNLLFILNATSLQLVPATVIALRASLGSSAAHDITLPSLIVTALSTGIAVALFLAADALSRRKKK